MVLIYVNNEGSFLADAVDFGSYLDFKPPEKAKAPKTPKKKATASAGQVNYYKKHENVFILYLVTISIGGVPWGNFSTLVVSSSLHKSCYISEMSDG